MPAEYSPRDLNGIFIDFPCSAAAAEGRLRVAACLAAMREKLFSFRLSDRNGRDTAACSLLRIKLAGMLKLIIEEYIFARAFPPQPEM